jgi:hypothetical protein
MMMVSCRTGKRKQGKKSKAKERKEERKREGKLQRTKIFFLECKKEGASKRKEERKVGNGKKGKRKERERPFSSPQPGAWKKGSQTSYAVDSID